MSPDSISFFLSATQAEALTSWRSSESNVISLYLPIDLPGAYPAYLDRLMREAPIKNPILKHLPRDFERITRFVKGQFIPGTRRGLCVFSCATYEVFQAFAAPEPFHASLTVGQRPYVMPLSSVRRQYRRFLVLLADNAHARFLEIHLGEWSELEQIPIDLSPAGLKTLSERCEYWRGQCRSDRFVLGAAPNLSTMIEPVLNNTLQDGLINEPLLGPERPNAAVAERVIHNERQARKLRENVLVQHFLDQLRSGSAIAGLEASINIIQNGGAKLLLVRDGFAKLGRCCPACGRLSVDHRSCPWCFRTTEPVMDVVAEIAERAAINGVEVFRVDSDIRFESAGSIGVCLTQPITNTKSSIPTSRALRGLYATKDGRASPLRPRKDI